MDSREGSGTKATKLQPRKRRHSIARHVSAGKRRKVRANPEGMAQALNPTSKALGLRSEVQSLKPEASRLRRTRRIAALNEHPNAHARNRGSAHSDRYGRIQNSAAGCGRRPSRLLLFLAFLVPRVGIRGFVASRFLALREGD